MPLCGSKGRFRGPPHTFCKSGKFQEPSGWHVNTVYHSRSSTSAPFWHWLPSFLVPFLEVYQRAAFLFWCWSCRHVSASGVLPRKSWVQSLTSSKAPGVPVSLSWLLLQFGLRNLFRPLYSIAVAHARCTPAAFWAFSFIFPLVPLFWAESLNYSQESIHGSAWDQPGG